MTSVLHRRIRESVSATAVPQLQRADDGYDADDELRESAPSQSERDTAAKNGDAFSDGSYPITSQTQANNAWKLRNHSKTHSQAAVEAHIRKQVKKHNLTMPGSKTKESDVPEGHIALHAVHFFREAAKKQDDGSYECTIVREGPGNPGDKNYYTAQALRGMVPLCEGLQAYLNHPTPTEERERPERDVRYLAGHFKEARFVDGSPAEIRARFVPGGMDPTGVRNLIESALQSPTDRPLVGISIDGYGSAPDTQTVNGQTYNMVREVTHLGSADIVTRAGAGGKFHRRLQEAWRLTGPQSWPDTSKEATMKPAEMQGKVKDALDKFVEASKITDEDKAAEANQLIGDVLATLRECATAPIETEVEVKIQEKVVEKLVPASTEDKDQLAAKLATVETKLTEATTAIAAEKARADKAETQIREAEHAKLAAKVLREAEVSAKSAAAWIGDVLEQDDEAAMKRFVEAKKAERDELIAELQESYGGVEGAGARTPFHPAAPAGTSGLLGSLGINADDYVPAAS